MAEPTNVVLDPNADPASGDDLTVDLALQVSEIYGSTIGRNWQPLGDLVLPSDPNYSFTGGYFTQTDNILGDANAAVMIGVYAGKPTLLINFQGSDQDLDILHTNPSVGFASEELAGLTTATYYARYSALMTAIKTYLADHGADFAQVIITGYSLGGGVLEHAVEDLEAAATGVPISAFSFASVAATPGTLLDAATVASKTTNFVHADDIARGGARSGGDVVLNTFRAWDGVSQHVGDTYAADMLDLQIFANDAASVFYTTDLAAALRAGTVWAGDATSGDDIQIAVGSTGADVLRSRQEDNFALSGDGDDLIVLSPTATEFRVVDGGGGSDFVVLVSFGLAYDFTGITNLAGNALHRGNADCRTP